MPKQIIFTQKELIAYAISIVVGMIGILKGLPELWKLYSKKHSKIKCKIWFNRFIIPYKALSLLDDKLDRANYETYGQIKNEIIRTITAFSLFDVLYKIEINNNGEKPLKEACLITDMCGHYQYTDSGNNRKYDDFSERIKICDIPIKHKLIVYIWLLSRAEGYKKRPKVTFSFDSGSVEIKRPIFEWKKRI